MGKNYITVAASDSGITNADYICDGTADQVEINNALATIENMGTVYLYPGEYNLTGRIIVNRNHLTLRGEGTNTVLRRNAALTVWGLIDISAHYCTVRDFRMYLGFNEGIGSTKIGGVYSSGTNTKVINVNITSDLFWSENATITEINGIYMTQDKAKVERCYITGLRSTEDAYAIRCSGSNYTVTNNYVESILGEENSYCIHASGAGGKISNNNLMGSTEVVGRCMGIRVNGPSTAIQGNTCQNIYSSSDRAIGICVYGEKCAVSGNVCDNTKSSAATAAGLAILGVSNSISGNVCTDSCGVNVTSYSANIEVFDFNNTVTGNECRYTLKDNSRMANILVSGANNAITGNKAGVADGLPTDYGDLQHNILLTSSAKDNSVTSNNIMGKDVTDNSAGLTNKNYIADNKYSSNQGGYRGDSRFASVTVGTTAAGYTLEDVDYLCDGIDDQEEINEAISSLDHGGEVVLLHGQYNTTDAITISNAKITLRGMGNATHISNIYPNSAAMNTIRVPYDGCVVRDMQITSNVEIGGYAGRPRLIYVEANDCLIDHIMSGTCYCEGQIYGIYISGMRNKVKDCNISNLICDSYSYGIGLYNANECMISGNTCKYCRGSAFAGIGILVEGNSGQNIICGNTCSQNASYAGGYGIIGGNGIYIANGCNKNTINGNVCYNNTGNQDIGAGINVYGSENVITGNNCAAESYPSSQHNIRLDTTSANNLVTSNMVFGKDVTIAGTNNTVTNNKA